MRFENRPFGSCCRVLLLAAVVVMAVAPTSGTAGQSKQTVTAEYGEIDALEKKAIAAHSAHLYTEATELHRQAVELASRYQQPRLTAVLLRRLGHVLEDGGALQDALAMYETARGLVEGSKELNIATSGLLGARKGFGMRADFAPAPLYRDGATGVIASDEADPALSAKLLLDMGNAYFVMRQYDAAGRIYITAAKGAQSISVSAVRGYALANLGETKRRLGEPVEARVHLTQAIEILQALEDPLQPRRAISLLASLERDAGHRDTALHLYLQALPLYVRASDERGQAKTLAALGDLYLEGESLAKAAVSYEQSLTLATTSGDDETQWHAQYGLARAARRAGDLQTAAAALRRSLALVETRQRALRTDEAKVALYESVENIFDELIDVELSLAQSLPEKAFDALEIAEQSRARSLRDLMRGWSEGARPSLRSLGLSRCGGDAGDSGGLSRERDDPIRLRRDSPVQAAIGTPSTSPDDLDDPFSPKLGNMANQAAPGVSTTSDVAKRAVPMHGVHTVEAPPVTRLVFHVLREKTAAFLVTPEGVVHAHFSTLGAKELSERVTALRAMLRVDGVFRGAKPTGGDADRASEESRDAEADRLLKELYDALIAPLAAYLPKDGELIAIEPHDALWLLPFSALRTDDGRALFERWPTVYAPSYDILSKVRGLRLDGTPADWSALIVGNPMVGPWTASGGEVRGLDFEPLPGAEVEANKVAALFPESRRTLLLRDKADLFAVESRASKAQILHFATHGVADARLPLSSFLLLADSSCGRELTALRILTWPLAADLVSLSACQTGLGRVSGDGMIGLTRAFLVAGARSVLVSMWSVSDEATALLMSRFYALYLTHGKDKAAALQQAMKEVRVKYRSPRYWAPFVLVGAE